MADSRFNDPHEPDAATDRRIQSLLAAVPVPENLNERIKSRLRMQLLVDPCLEPGVDDGLESNAQPNLIGSEVRTGQIAQPTGDARGVDRWRRAFLAVALAGMLAGFAILANRWGQPHERDWLVSQSHSLLEKWEQDNPANLVTGGSLAEVPATVREQLTRVTLRGTRSLTDLSSRFKGTLYRLDAADGHSLLLIKLTDLPAVRGLNSRFSGLTTPSGGWSLAALQVNNETFVLAAECTQEQLMGYVRRPVVT